MNAFQTLADVLARKIGIVIDARRRIAFEMRLAPIMESHGFLDLGDLAAQLGGAGENALLAAVTEAIVINETLFFRDREPFEQFRTTMLSSLVSARAAARQLRIWSAACSTGQEPYSLAMILDEESRRLLGWHVDIVATDISRSALEIAREGCYSHFEVQRGLTAHHLLRYFRKDDSRWIISEHLRAHVNFAQRNLLADFRALGKFDVIFCRNVLMYMDVECRRDILKRLANSLAPDGFLVLGAAETIVGLSDAFMQHPAHPSVFVRRASEARPALRLVAEG